MKTPIEAYPEDIRHIPQDPYPPMEVDFNAHKREGYEKAVEEMKNELVEWLGGQTLPTSTSMGTITMLVKHTLGAKSSKN